MILQLSMNPKHPLMPKQHILGHAVVPNLCRVYVCVCVCMYVCAVVVLAHIREPLMSKQHILGNAVVPNLCRVYVCMCACVYVRWLCKLIYVSPLMLKQHILGDMHIHGQPMMQKQQFFWHAAVSVFMFLQDVLLK